MVSDSSSGRKPPRDELRDQPSDEPLDVVARLADHQQNLWPAPPTPSRVALLALPLPRIVDALLGAERDTARSNWLADRAAELGGGDGPLPIVDLGGEFARLGTASATCSRFDARLDALGASGVRRLIVVGGQENRGFARAVAARWSGELQPLQWPLDAWLANVPALRDDERPPPDGRQAVRASDPARRLGPWWGFVPPRALLGTREGAELRAAWQAYWCARGRPDAVRCAVLGLDSDLEAALQVASCSSDSPPPSDRAGALARHVAITGLDGAGKSTHAARLAAAQAARGRQVAVVKIYRQGAFLELAGELGARTRRGAPLAAFRVSRLVKLIDSARVLRDRLAPIAGSCDLLLLDRWLETHVAAARSQLGWDLSGHPLLAAFPHVDRRYWLELDPAQAIARLDARPERRSADEHATGLRGYAREFNRLAVGTGERRLAASAPIEENAARLLAEVDTLLGPPRAGGAVVAIENAAPPRLPFDPARERCAVHLGAATDGSELGRDLFALRADLRQRSGAVLDGLPEATWIEAYAAELLLALATTRPRRAAVALWPAALALMEELGDLPMLDELARMVEAETIVGSWGDRVEVERAAAEAFRAFGFAPRGAERFAASYGDSLRALSRAWSAAPIAPAS